MCTCVCGRKQKNGGVRRRSFSPRLIQPPEKTSLGLPWGHRFTTVYICIARRIHRGDANNWITDERDSRSGYLDWGRRRFKHREELGARLIRRRFGLAGLDTSCACVCVRDLFVTKARQLSPKLIIIIIMWKVDKVEVGFGFFIFLERGYFKLITKISSSFFDVERERFLRKVC